MSLSSAVKCASVACLVLALFEMPDEFYKVLRFVVLAGAIFTVVDVQKSRLSQNWKTVATLAFSLTAIVFNPFWPLEMERDEWLLFDFLGAIMFGAILLCETRVQISAGWKKYGIRAIAWITGFAALCGMIAILNNMDAIIKDVDAEFRKQENLRKDKLAQEFVIKLEAAVEKAQRQEYEAAKALPQDQPGAIIPTGHGEQEDYRLWQEQQEKVREANFEQIKKQRQNSMKSTEALLDKARESAKDKATENAEPQTNTIDGKEVRKALPVEVRKAIPVK